MLVRSIHYVCISGLLIICALFVVEPIGAQGQPGKPGVQDTVSQTADTTVTSVKREQIRYESEGRRDPFLPLIEEKDEEEEELPLLQLEEATLVGIMRGPGGGLALVQDKEDRTYILREGAKIKNGYLYKVKKDVALFHLAKYGRYRTVELELKSEKRAANFEQSIKQTSPAMRHTIPPAQPAAETEIPVPIQPAGLSVLEGLSKFTLQVAAFRRESDARRLQQWLRERDFETRIEEATIPESGLWYRVRLGVYDSYDDVRSVAETFRQRFDFYCWIVPIDS